MRNLLLLLLTCAAFCLTGCETTQSLKPFDRTGTSRLFELREGTPVALHQAPDVEPVIIQRIMPTLPSSTTRGGIYTQVVVSYIITAEGYTSSVRVLKATQPEAGEAVVQAVRGWVFTPAIHEGEPVSVAQRLQFTYGIRPLR